MTRTALARRASPLARQRGQAAFMTLIFAAVVVIGAKYLGRVLESDVGGGKPILKSYLDTRFPVDFSDTVAIGRRALTIQVDDLTSIAGFLRPGNHIDLFVNLPSALSGISPAFVTADLIDAIPPEMRATIPPTLLNAARGASTSDTEIKQLMSGAIPKDVILPVLLNVRVLATGRDPYREELDQIAYPQARTQHTFNSLTLDLSPREAALVTTAVKKGEMLALLRNRNDQGTADFSTLSGQDLFSNAFKMAKTDDERRTRVAVASGLDQASNLVDASGKTILNQEQLRAASLTVNTQGQLVDKNGNVVDAKDLVVTADGRILDKKALAAAGLSIDANGNVVDKNGNVVDSGTLIATKDGVMSQA